MFEKPTVCEFFAGSGLVRQGLGLWFEVLWANDICPKKADVYSANFGDNELVVDSIENVSGTDIPDCDLAWASFPCQDLSLAGNRAGLGRKTRSGLFWQWLRVLDEIPDFARPKVIALENVVGWFTSNHGHDFSNVYFALKERGYKAGALVINAEKFVPQSRPRAFLIAVRSNVETTGLTQSDGELDQTYFSKAVLSAANSIRDSEWIWWHLPEPPLRNHTFTDICEFDVPCDETDTTQYLIDMLSPRNADKLSKQLVADTSIAGTGYRRTRKDPSGKKVQRLEIRFDGVAGCLRTPEGGSSRQTVLIVENGTVRSRLLTVREAARLMGAPDDFKIPGSYYDGYKAMGDAVCVPVVSWLAEHLLSPLCLRGKRNFVAAAE